MICVDSRRWRLMILHHWRNFVLVIMVKETGRNGIWKRYISSVVNCYQMIISKYLIAYNCLLNVHKVVVWLAIYFSFWIELCTSCSLVVFVIDIFLFAGWDAKHGHRWPDGIPCPSVAQQEEGGQAHRSRPSSERPWKAAFKKCDPSSQSKFLFISSNNKHIIKA